MTKYSDKLKHPKWQEKRLDVLSLKGYNCEACTNVNEQLQVHHINYIGGNEPWEYPNNNFLVLCDACHKKEHAYRDQALTNIYYAFEAVNLPIDNIINITNGINTLALRDNNSRYANVGSIIKFMLENESFYNDIVIMYHEKVKKNG